MISVRGDRRGWVEVIVVAKGNSWANGNVHDGVAAGLRAVRIGEAKGAEGGRPRPGGTCSGAIPTGDSRVEHSVCVTR